MNWRLKWLLVFVLFTLAGSVGGWMLYTVPAKRFYVTARVLLDRAGPIDGVTKTISLGSDGFRRTLVYNKLAILKGGDTIARATAILESRPADLEEVKKGLLSQVCDPDDSADFAARCLKYYMIEQVDTEVDRNADLVQLRLSSTQPEVARLVLSAMIEAWIAENKEQKRRQTEESFAVVTTKLADVERSLAEQRAKVEAFLSDNPNVANDKIIDHLLKRSDDLKSEILKLESEAAALDVDVKQKLSKEEVEKLTGVKANARREQLLSDAENELFEDGLKQIPEIQRRRASIAKALKGTYSEQKEQLQELAKLPKLMGRYHLLSLELELETGIFLKLKEKTSELQFSRLVDHNEIAVVDPPERSLRSHFPKLSISFGVGVISAWSLFAALMLLSFKRIDLFTAGRLQGLRSAGAISKSKSVGTEILVRGTGVSRDTTKPKAVQRVIGLTPSFERSIRLIAGQNPKRPHRICVVGPSPGCGKSTCSLGLAFAGALRGRTLLVDFDLRRTDLNTSSEAKSSTKASKAKVVVSQIAVSSSQLSIDVLTFEAQEGYTVTFLEAITEFERFDLSPYQTVIFDTPPFGLFADALELVRHVDSTVIVARHGVTMTADVENILLELTFMQVDRNAIWSLQNCAPAPRARGAYGYLKRYRVQSVKSVQPVPDEHDGAA